MNWRDRLLAFLRVPAAPSAPAGDADVTIFRAAPRYYHYRIIRWALGNVTGIIGLIFGVAFLRSVPTRVAGFGAIDTIFWTLEAFAIAGFVLQAAGRLALLRLDIEQRWYLVSDRSLRIREGLVRLNEKTMTFANIQNLRIEQGPLQRLLGIADVQVRTAGGGSGGAGEGEHEAVDKNLHVGYFRGVADAERIRDTIRDRLRRYADAGLGDPDDARPAASTAAVAPSALAAAARALANEASALRQAAIRRDTP